MKKLALFFVGAIFALMASGQPSTLIEYPIVIKHMSNKDETYRLTVGKKFVGYSTISQGDSMLYYSTSGTPAGRGTYASPLPIDSINTLQSNGKKVLARIKRGDTYGTITLADSNIVVCSYSTVNTTAKPVINYVDYFGKANVEVNNITQTYNGYRFVSNSGNDTYPGTKPDSAWATIAKVNAATFNAGDNILFNRGDEWRGESLTVGWSGTESNPITFGAYGTGAKPVFNGAEIVTDWVERRTNLWVKKAPLSEPFRTVVVIDDDLFYPKATLAAVDADLEYFVEDSTGTNGDSIYVYSTTNPSTRTTELSTRIFGVTDGLSPDAVSAYITIKDLEFKYYGYAGVDARSTQANGNFLVDNCTFYHNREFAVHFYDGHNNNTVQNCTVSYCGNGLYANEDANYNSFIGNNITNTFSYTGLALGNTDGHAIGVYNSKNVLVENNYIAYGNAALIGLDRADVVIRYNEVHSDGTPSSPGQCLAAFRTELGDTLDIYYNIFYGERLRGSNLKFNTVTGKANVYNNTMVADTGLNLIDIQYADNILLKNNILYNIGAATNLINILEGTSEPLVSNYNLWYNKLPAPNYVNSFATLAAWQIARSDDLNSLDGNPFVVSESTNLNLQAGSTAINAGVNVGLTRDILGNPITGNPDIGAYEFIDNGDVTAPVVTFTIPSTSYLVVSVTTFTATDNIGVTGYLITESATAPLASNTGWVTTAPTSYTFSTPGSKTLYAWARDKNGNVSSSVSDGVTASYDLSTLDDGLIAWYDFDETTGLLQDLSGNGLHASSHASNITIDQTGNPTKSYLFNTANGGSQRITIDDNSLLTPADSFTVVMWVNLNAVDRYHTLLGKVAGSNLEYLTFIDSNNKLFFNIYQNGTTTKTSRTTTDALSNNTDYCIIFETSNILAASAGKIFINNSVWVTNSVGSSTITNVLNGTGTVTIGNEGQINYTGLSANVSQTIMYGRILTANEKAALYNSGSGISYSDL